MQWHRQEMKYSTDSNNNHKVSGIAVRIVGALVIGFLLLQLLKYCLTGTIVTILPAGLATVTFMVRSMTANYNYRHPMAFRVLLAMIGILGIFIFIIPCMRMTEWCYRETEGLFTPGYCFFGVSLLMVTTFLWSRGQYKKHIEADKEKASRPYALAMAFSIALFLGQGLASISAHQNIEQEKWETGEENQTISICQNCQKAMA